MPGWQFAQIRLGAPSDTWWQRPCGCSCILMRSVVWRYPDSPPYLIWSCYRIFYGILTSLRVIYGKFMGWWPCKVKDKGANAHGGAANAHLTLGEKERNSSSRGTGNEVGARLYFHRRLWFCPREGRVCLSACWDTTPPPEQTPWADTTPQSRPPPGADPHSTEHAGRYGQRVGGAHSTGMQSCI